jgi:hypothetical protein
MPNDQSPRPIDYGRPAARQPLYIPATVQVAAGVISTIAMVGAIWGLLAVSAVPPVLCLSVPIGALISLVVYVRVRQEWRSFLPGVLIGFGLCCFLGFGTLFYLCSHQ